MIRFGICADRQVRTHRPAELAQYDAADWAERALCNVEPENRLVARTGTRRQEQRQQAAAQLGTRRITWRVPSERGTANAGFVARVPQDEA